ncbi:hypothetical protein VRY85_13740 [Achromobacter sp. F4_2707]|uniref:baeRF11 domain-containing protein n=1 Tax=Achromobacter sp. F4_2707 TaxID=3114286 RepID=UPI0039C60483
MLYVDIPTRNEFSLLASQRSDACVSIYLKTTPVTQEVQATRIQLGNLIKEAHAQLEKSGFDKRRLAALLGHLNDLLDDDKFWRFQASSLAVFATPDSIRTYRLANDLTSMVQVADRFHLKPLFRAVTFPHAAFILTLSENAVRLFEMNADQPAKEIEVQALPDDMASSVGPIPSDERVFSGRSYGKEGHNVRLQQYVRLVDSALRPILAGRETPLVLAATGRLADLFKQICSYPHLLAETISESPDRLTEAELTARARPVLDNAYAGQIADIKALFEKRVGQRRTTTDISDAARAATFGAIQTLLVDIDAVVPGFVDEETGEVSFVQTDDAKAYGVIDEITARAFASGATVFGVRREDIPGGHDLAAILRYPH